MAPTVFLKFLCYISGLEYARQFSPLLVHAAPLDLQEQGEKVFIVHGARSTTALVLQSTLCLYMRKINV